MKTKVILLTFIFSLFTLGCEVTAVEHINYRDGLSRHEATLVVRGVLHMQPHRYTRYGDRYGYYYDGEIDNSKFGYLTYTTVDQFYGYHDYNPYLGSFEIYPGRYDEYDYISLEVIDVDFVYITIYDYYGSSRDRFRMTWRELGY